MGGVACQGGLGPYVLCPVSVFPTLQPSQPATTYLQHRADQWPICLQWGPDPQFHVGLGGKIQITLRKVPVVPYPLPIFTLSLAMAATCCLLPPL